MDLINTDHLASFSVIDDWVFIGLIGSTTVSKLLSQCKSIQKIKSPDVNFILLRKFYLTFILHYLQK